MAPHHNFVAIAPVIIKFGTGATLGVFYTISTKNSLLRYYYVVMAS